MSDYNELLNSLKAAAGSAASIAKDLAETASEKARDIAGNAGAKAKALARMAKLMHEANAQRGELDAAYAEIGRVYFESADKKNPGELYLRLFDKVMLANAAIERTETEMNELRAQLSEQGIDVDFSDVVDEAEAAAEEPAGDKVFEFSIYLDRKDEGAEPDVEVEITEEKSEE